MRRAHLSRKQRKELQATVDENVVKSVTAKYEAVMHALIASDLPEFTIRGPPELRLDFAEKRRFMGELEEVAPQEKEKKRQAKQVARDAKREHARQKAREESEEVARQERQAKRVAIDAELECARQKEKE